MLKDNIIEWMLEIFDNIVTDKIIERKRTILQKFFALGSVKDSNPSVRIIYPPIPWEEKLADITHLLPYMVIEDFQAIHKLTKDLNIVGCDDIKAMTTEVYDEHTDRFSNKIFICLPRNPCAQTYLKKISEARFDIKSSTEKSKKRKYIIWKGGKNNEPICVYSPQSKYLSIQRRRTTNMSWKNDPGSCTAVDFAIVARFRDPSLSQFPDIGTLSCIFVFGIRGLGTWGAAWYIDRCYEDISKKIIKDESLQILLRVEYRNHRIRSIVDVSDEPQKYFNEENSDKFIKSKINRYIT